MFHGKNSKSTRATNMTDTHEASSSESMSCMQHGTYHDLVCSTVTVEVKCKSDSEYHERLPTKPVHRYDMAQPLKAPSKRDCNIENTCDKCAKSFSKKRYLTKHMIVHTGGKQYTCDLCKISFAQKRYLVKHMRVHTGDKPYTCDRCITSFSRKQSLVNHMKVHVVDKPHVFTCNICMMRNVKMCKFVNQ
jgi:uncharacterized Zn-finger protein